MMRTYRIHREVQLRPRADSSYIARNRTTFITGRDGFIDPATDQGLFVHKTRVLSLFRYLLNGKQPQETGLSNLDSDSWLGYYLIQSPTIDHEDRINGPGGVLAQHPVELRLNRVVGDGLREQVTLTNYTQKPLSVSVHLLFDADFADQSEVGGERKQNGRLERQSREGEGGIWETHFSYEAANTGGNGLKAEVHREAIVQIMLMGGRSSALKSFSGDHTGVTFLLQLEPHAAWTGEVTVAAVIEGDRLPLPGGPNDEQKRQQTDFLEGASSFSCAPAGDLGPVVVRSLEQARHDLVSLGYHDVNRGAGDSWTFAAGLPVYSELFGRDTLTASWQAAILGPQMMQGTLRELARWQGKKEDNWRDEQPGKMPHQVSIAPVASLGFNPFDRYYGSITTSGFYPFVVSQLWHWTGEKKQVQPFVESALRCFDYLDNFADLDGDGFYEYQTRSPEGLKNQAWKDSDDAIVYEDGSQVPTPIATCEEQAFVYAAKFHFSEVLWRLGRRDEAKKLYHEASELKKRFNDRFWMEREEFVALALDPDKRLVRSISSNPGHCLAAGILDEAVVERVADGLMGPELFSGWGIRTLASSHPAFNPYSYHRGSVWPVEQATFALGLWRYGLHRHLNRLARAQFEAAALYDFCRLPELFTGHPRDESHPFPAVYPNACWPQAWSASALFCILQSMLGLYPYAPLNLLLVDPHLPDWLPDITLNAVQVGEGRVSLRFYRDKHGDSEYEVLEKRGSLHVVRQPSPWSTTSGPIERVMDLFESLTTL
ncbi:MAG: amylo-alpha-1,6-glucosidase [Acidobacteria bacterium]|nr:MAG: amylo-alpha-1,6-glucosidase [Acidobacteriota bacterium]